MNNYYKDCPNAHAKLIEAKRCCAELVRIAREKGAEAARKTARFVQLRRKVKAVSDLIQSIETDPVREVLIMKYIKGQRNTEIAQALCYTPRYVSQLRRVGEIEIEKKLTEGNAGL